MRPARAARSICTARSSPGSTLIRRTPTTSSGSGSGPLVERRISRSRRWHEHERRRELDVCADAEDVCLHGRHRGERRRLRATDPWVSFGPSGIVYQLSLSFNDVAPPFRTFDFDLALLASRSTNGGLTWSDPVVVIRDTAPTVFNDKQSITADPTNPSYVYAVWDRLVFPASERVSSPRSVRARSAARPGSPALRTRA
jgi:hypothetical protein